MNLKKIVIAIFFTLIILVLYIPWVHPFLAITKRVDANVLVVEGWVPNNVLEYTAKEFLEGGYLLVATSGIQIVEDESGLNSHAHRAASKLVEFGLSEVSVVMCPSEPVSWNRTGVSARAVRDQLKEMNINLSGVNVVTAGPHARQTYLAYRRVFSDTTQVGIISVPKIYYDQDRWWASWAGIKWTNKDFIAWIKEVLFGYRS